MGKTPRDVEHPLVQAQTAGESHRPPFMVIDRYHESAGREQPLTVIESDDTGGAAERRI